MAIPDFGHKEESFQDEHMKAHNIPPIVLSCRCIVPGLTLQELIVLYSEIEKNCKPEDAFAGDPTKWPKVKALRAVINKVLEAVYEDRGA